MSVASWHAELNRQLSRLGLLVPTLFLACAVFDAPPSQVLPSSVPVEPHPDRSASQRNSAAEAGSGDDLFGLSRSQLWARWNLVRSDPYELDELDRFVEGGQKKVRCSPEGLVTYRGEALRYHVPLTVNPAFRERLGRFEQVVADVSREVYGRAPRRIQHYGAYSCRTSRNRSHRLSEHALGNAVDVVGFDFGPATKAEPLGGHLPPRLGQSFQVRVAKHWAPGKDEVTAAHGRFLRLLTERLIERRDIFRGFVGPGHEGHSDHFHFDVAPWRYVRL